MNTYNSACNSCIKIMTVVFCYRISQPSAKFNTKYVTCILVFSITLVLHVIYKGNVYVN